MNASTPAKKARELADAFNLSRVFDGTARASLEDATACVAYCVVRRAADGKVVARRFYSVDPEVSASFGPLTLAGLISDARRGCGQ